MSSQQSAAKNLKVYFVNKSITSYVDALEAIEKLTPIEGVEFFEFHGYADKDLPMTPSGCTIYRKIGSRPALFTPQNAVYTATKILNGISSIVVVSSPSKKAESQLICVISECEVWSVVADSEELLEKITLRAVSNYPWVYVEDVLKG